jgi:chitosanase
MTPLQEKTIKAIVNIFETGRAAGNYSAVTVLAGDSGHLTYGRSQSALGSGTLFQLLSQYCVAPGAKFAAQIEPYLPRVEARDIKLDNDATLRNILREAGADPVMQAEQDRFFDVNYFNPACTSASACGLNTPLAQAIVYDSHVQGNWRAMRDAANQKCGAPGANGVTEQQWATVYVQTRKQWLLSSHPPLPATAYRMDAFLNLIAGGNWNLDLPIQVHGVTIATADLDEPPAGPR